MPYFKYVDYKSELVELIHEYKPIFIEYSCISKMILWILNSSFYSFEAAGASKIHIKFPLIGETRVAGNDVS